MDRCRRLLVGALAASVAVAACGTSPSGDLVGESAHFRLYVDPELPPVPVAFKGNDGLAALEANWSDAQPMLKMPEGKIEYHWATQGHVSEWCNFDGGLQGCELEGEVVISTSLPHPHELNHAYMELIAHKRPVSFLAEGIAEAFGCGVSAGAYLAQEVPWQHVVAQTPSSPSFADLYSEGGLLARYLIRTSGIDAFLAYYRQAPEIRDPALFVDNFAQFWNTSLDDTWDAMHTLGPGQGLHDTAICPCTMPLLVVDGGAPLDSNLARVPYWTVPDVVGRTIALQSPNGSAVDVIDCQGNTSDIVAGGQAALARLDTPSYVLAPLASAVSGAYISDTCEGAALYVVPSNIVNGELDLRVGRSTVTSTDLYLQLQAPASTTTISILSGTMSTCASCAFDTVSCQQTGHSSPIQGTFYVRIPFGSSAFNPSANTVFNALFFY